MATQRNFLPDLGLDHREGGVIPGAVSRFRLSLLLVAVLNVPAFAQMPNLESIARQAVQPPVGDPVEPPPKIPEVPADKAFEFSALESERDGSNVHLKGQVTIKFKEFTAVCEEAFGNTKTRIFDLKGKVQVSGPGLNYDGDSVTVNFKDKTVEFANAGTVVEPSLVKGGLQQNLIIRGERGKASETHYVLVNGNCTTCDLPTPHYHLRAREIEVFKDDRIILRHVGLVIKGKTILSLPYLSLPLDEHLPRYLPEVGKSADEGYFVKTRWGIGLQGDDLLDAKVDLMSKLGTGLGAEFKYRDSIIKGTAKVYNVFGPRTTRTASLDHSQLLGHGTLTLTTNYGDQNYMTAPQNEQFTLNGVYAFPFLNGKTRLSLNHVGNRSSSFRSATQSLTLRDERIWGSDIHTVTDVKLNSYTSRSGSFSQDRRVVDLSFLSTKRFSSFDAELAYQRSVPIGEIENFFSATDRTPLLSLRSDTNRLFGVKNPGKFNLIAEFTAGELIDAVKREPIRRSTVELTLPQQAVSYGRSDIQIAGRFKQGFYSDDTAQFVFGADAGYRYRLGGDSYINIRYNYLRPQGYSPLQMDRFGRTDLIGGDVSFRLHPTLVIAAQSGYDLMARERNLASSWQTVGARLEWSPSPSFQFRTSATYDTYACLWNSVRLDALVFQGQSTKFYMGARYDGTRSQFGAVNFIAEGMRWGKLTAGFLLGWNGYTREFETRQASLMYDLHDADALLEVTDNKTGFRNGTSVAFFIRLKAMPFLTPFGKGTRGQGFGTGTGVNF